MDKEYTHSRIGKFRAKIIEENKTHKVLEITEMIKIVGKGGIVPPKKVGDRIRFINKK